MQGKECKKCNGSGVVQSPVNEHLNRECGSCRGYGIARSILFKILKDQKKQVEDKVKREYKEKMRNLRVKIKDNKIAEIEAAAVERFVKERFWNSACEVSACVAESGMQWAENRRKEAQG